MKLKQTDIVTVVAMYAVCAFFGYMNLSVKAAAQTYPWFVIGMLFVLTTIYLVKIIIDGVKNGKEGGWEEAFEGFLPKQFVPIFLMIVGYVVVMKYFGFYIATLIFVVATLHFLKVPKWQIALVVVVLFVLAYGAFTMFLGVKLPQGAILKNLF